MSLTHGIVFFQGTGKIHPSIYHRRKLKNALNKLEDSLRAAAVLHPKNDILIDLIRFNLTIVGLYSYYISMYGPFREDDLKKKRLESHGILKTVFASINTIGRLLDRVEWKESEDAPRLEDVIEGIVQKRKKKSD